MQSHKDLILIVDDNPTNLNVLVDYLGEQGFELAIAKDGERAIEQVHRLHPDLILLDVLMPGIDGFETCRRLKANHRSTAIPVIFMTALSETVNKVKGFELGAVDYVTKPFQQEEVLARIQAHLTIRHLRQELEQKNQKLTDILTREQRFIEDWRRNFSFALPHELRTPLVAIMGFAELIYISAEKRTIEQLKEYAADILKSGQRLNRIVENSMIYAQYSVLKNFAIADDNLIDREVIECDRVIREIVEKKFDQATNPCQLDLQPARIAAAEFNFRKIIGELVDNAIKFSDPNDPVTISCQRPAAMVEIVIQDQGCGMSEQQLAHIDGFVQFNRTYLEQQGMGIGLAIARLLTLVEKGTFRIDSQINRGTTITLSFSAIE